MRKKQLTLALDQNAKRIRLNRAEQIESAIEYINTLLGRPSVIISGAKMIAWRKPAVYAWIRDGAVLYVGKAGSGIARPCSPQHEAITTDAIHSGDTIAIWACRASSEALFEQHLIDHLKPSRNRAVTRWAGEALAVHDKYSREGKKHARRLSHEDR